MVAICQERGANDLHMVQNFRWCYYHPVISCFIKTHNCLSIWCRLIQVVLEKSC